MESPEEKVLQIVIAAGAGIMEIRRRKLGAFEQKSDLSPVTEADLWASSYISEELARLTPGKEVISEEGSFAQVPNDFWIVDPLDGTREFINGLDDFTVNVARVVNGRPTFGVVYLPATGECYFGGAGHSSKFRDSSGQRNIQVNQEPGVVRIAVSRSHLDTDTVEFCNKFQPHEKISAGSSLKFCLVADGRADLYPRFGRTMEWDTAAGQAVLEGAGGTVIHASTLNRLDYGKPMLENPGFIAVGSSSLRKQLKDFE